MDPAIAADFFKPEIRDLPVNYLRDWFGAAFSPDGVSRDVWTYLLPRILEVLAAGGEVSNTGIELVLARFETGKADQWNPDQWSVLDRFQRQYLRAGSVTAESWPRPTLDDVLCMFRRGGWPLDGLLSQAEELPDPALAERLWQDWCDYRSAGGTIDLSPFWRNSERDIVYGFYTSEGLRSRMEALALAGSTPTALAEKASILVDVIEMH